MIEFFAIWGVAIMACVIGEVAMRFFDNLLN